MIECYFGGSWEMLVARSTQFSPNILPFNLDCHGTSVVFCIHNVGCSKATLHVKISSYTFAWWNMCKCFKKNILCKMMNTHACRHTKYFNLFKVHATTPILWQEWIWNHYPSLQTSKQLTIKCTITMFKVSVCSILH